MVLVVLVYPVEAFTSSRGHGAEYRKISEKKHVWVAVTAKRLEIDKSERMAYMEVKEYFPALQVDFLVPNCT